MFSKIENRVYTKKKMQWSMPRRLIIKHFINTYSMFFSYFSDFNRFMELRLNEIMDSYGYLNNKYNVFEVPINYDLDICRFNITAKNNSVVPDATTETPLTSSIGFTTTITTAPPWYNEDLYNQWRRIASKGDQVICYVAQFAHV